MRAFLKRAFRHTGYELRRVDPQASLGFLLTRLLGELEITTVVDVGANEGQFGIGIRGDGYTGEIISFEPVSAPLATLQDRARHDGKWTVHPFALGSAAGTADINIPQTGTDVSSLRARADTDSLGIVGDISRTERIRIERLDAALPKLPRCLLKLDTQGWDLEVMRGATGVLDSVAVIQSELSFKAIYDGQPTWREALDYFSCIGFEPAGFYPVFRDKNWALVEADCVLVRR
jgi:FkbM family methyltransferase